VIDRQREVASQKGVFQMKNTYKLLSIIAMVAVIALSMTACDLEDPGDDKVQKILTITGIPETFNGKQITVAICDSDKKGEPKIVALDQLNSKSTVTSHLMSGNENKKGDYFTGTGSFYIFLWFDVPNTKDDLNDDTCYAYTAGSNIVKKYTIKDEESTIPFSDFTIQ
jgi:hypothetical protein